MAELRRSLPFWSLCNEAAYYAWFGAMIFLPRKQAFIAIGAGMLLAGPAIALLFVVWLLGAAVLQVQAKAPNFKHAGLAYLAAASMLAWTLFWNLSIPEAPSVIGPMLHRQLALALVAAVGLLGLSGLVRKFARRPADSATPWPTSLRPRSLFICFIGL